MNDELNFNYNDFSKRTPNRNISISRFGTPLNYSNEPFPNSILNESNGVKLTNIVDESVLKTKFEAQENSIRSVCGYYISLKDIFKDADIEIKNKLLQYVTEFNNSCKTFLDKKIEDLKNKKVKNTEEISKIKNIIEVKTTEMKKYLNEICEEKFQTYKDENSEVLKNFNKIYGKKILTKANKVQKEKIYEDRINEHIKMKDLMENMTKYVNEYNIKNKELNEKIIEQTNEYDKIMTQVDEINFNLEEKNLKNKSEREAHEKLKNEIDNKVKEQSIKLKTEKEKLEKKENLDFYIEKIKKLNNDLKNIEKKKEKIFEQFSLFFQQVQEEQLKLQEQSHQLKLQLLEFKSIEDENAFGSKVRNINYNEINNNNEEEKKKKRKKRRKRKKKKIKKKSLKEK